MPQFDFANVFVSQLFWLAIFFAILYFGVVQLTLPKLGKLMQTREDKMTGDLSAAESAKGTADRMGEEYRASIARARENARTVLAEAKADAGRETEAKLTAATEASDREIAAAETRIGEARAAALGEIETVAVESAQAIVARITGNQPDEGEARKAARSALQLQEA